MTKKTSKLLTLLLAFSMVFTTFGYVGGYEVNAANTDTLSVKVVDQDSNPVTGLKLYVDNDDEGAVEFGPTNSDGEASHKFAWTTDGIFGELEKYEVSLSVGDSENWEITEGVVFTAVVSDPTSGYIETVNGESYDGRQVTIKLTAKGGDPQEDVDYVDMQKNDKNAWNANGISYADITASDFILDVRNDDAWKTGFLPGSVHISVNTQDTALVNEGKVVADSVLAKALDSAFAASEGKRIVVVCNSGNVLAARAMEYFNTKNYGGKGVDLSRVTFLIGGAAVIPAEKKVTTLDYIDLQKNNKPAWNANGIPYADITDDDFILDVRNDDLFAAGHLKGSTHVKVTDPASDLDNGYVKADSNMAKALDAAYAASGDKRIVVICNTGNSLAARALQYYNTKNCGGSGADYTKLTFLIGGYSVIPASDVVTDEDEAAADAIEDKINALPAADKVTTADKAAIEATRKAYDALSDAQKKLVDPSVLKKLTDAEAALKKAEDAKAKKVKTVTVNTKTVNAKAIDAAVKKAGGNEKYVTKIVLGKKVKKISKNSFKKYKKTTTLEIKTKKLKKSSVKGSLKGSKIKTVQVKVGKKKVNKKYVKKYKKIFTKKNAGKKVKVK